jgi:hypothetical protein
MRAVITNEAKIMIDFRSEPFIRTINNLISLTVYEMGYNSEHEMLLIEESP